MSGILSVLLGGAISLRNAMTAATAGGFVGYCTATSPIGSAHGSIASPNTDFSGTAINGLYFDGGGDVVYVLNEPSLSDPGKSHFTNLTISGAGVFLVLTSASSSYTPPSAGVAYATWRWVQTNPFTGGNTYQFAGS